MLQFFTAKIPEGTICSLPDLAPISSLLCDPRVKNLKTQVPPPTLAAMTRHFQAPQPQGQLGAWSPGVPLSAPTPLEGKQATSCWTDGFPPRVCAVVPVCPPHKAPKKQKSQLLFL